MRLIDAGRIEEAQSEVEAALNGGVFDEVSKILWSACSAPPKRLSCTVRLPAHGEPHEKELRLLAHVLTHAKVGDPESVCREIERFGGEFLAPAGQWLKIAGAEKAEVLVEALRAAPTTGRTGTCRVLEVGTYCGYSAVRMASSRQDCEVTSIEADPARVAIARCLVAFAGLTHAVTVWTGHSQDVLPSLTKTGAEYGFGAVFLDQRGARFGTDLAVLETSGVLLPGAVIVADNVLKPGAPAYLWRMVHGGDYETQIRSVMEFAMSDTEDWMSVSLYRPNSEQHRTHGQPPAEIRRLEWEADRVRMRAQDCGSGPGVGFSEWARFSRDMRRRLAHFGIAPVPSKA